MTPARRQRLFLILLMIAGLGAAAALGLNAFQKNLLFFFTPSQVAAGEAPQDRPFRIGGLVEKGSLQRDGDSLTLRFIVTDKAKDVTVQYTGILPDLFREGQGIVARGTLTSDRVFVAEEVLAKHDENYMPPEAHDALKAAETLDTGSSK
ncbi:MAG: cytochrome c maturation protein CcmE [Gammaproteobacteria bacterium]|jgi:cytochrome c-type biogenesis protein CcmE|nr:cytochrome c maturation protein CcmE [Gammaproteobacteria bacterium]